jgi:hypothetical protein
MKVKVVIWAIEVGMFVIYGRHAPSTDLDILLF